MDDDFKRMVFYFWKEKGDPERFSGWSEEHCEKVWPEFLMAWRNYKAARGIVTAVANTLDEDDR